MFFIIFPTIICTCSFSLYNGVSFLFHFSFFFLFFFFPFSFHPPSPLRDKTSTLFLFFFFMFFPFYTSDFSKNLNYIYIYMYYICRAIKQLCFIGFFFSLVRSFLSLSLSLTLSFSLSLSLSLEWMCRRFLKKGRAVNFDDEIACSKTTASHPTSPTPPSPNSQIIKSFLWPNRIPPPSLFPHCSSVR